MKRAAILAIGEELVTGELADGNSSYVATSLEACGYEVSEITIVGDRLAPMVAALRRLTGGHDLVLVGGGLGPTDDDMTRQALADLCGEPLEESAAARASVEGFFARIGRPLKERDHVQLLAPRNAQVIANPVGTAPGLAVQHEGCTVVALPGVPRELRALLPEVLGALAATAPARVRTVLQLCGLAEAKLGERLRRLPREVPGIAWGTAAKEGVLEVHLRATGAEGPAILAQGATWLERELGRHVIGGADESLAGNVLRHLRERGDTVAVAESCTGGKLAAALTAVPGASASFLLGAVTYANEAKERVLGVSHDLLAEHGAVSEPVAAAMATGVLELAGADWALSTTGVAGPGGGTEEKPVGLVWIALARRDGEVQTKEFRLAGDRPTIQARTVNGVLWALLERLRTA